MFPEIPESFDGMSAADLKALHVAYKAATLAFTGTAGYDVSEARKHLAETNRLKAAADAALAAEEVDAQAKALADEKDDEVEVADDTPDVQIVEPDSDDEEDDESDDDDDEEPEVKAAAPAKRKVRRTVGGAASDDAPKPGAPAPSMVLAASGVDGKTPGEAFGSWAEVAQAMATKAEFVNPNAAERVSIGAVHGHFAENQILTALQPAPLR
jgi:regulator of RNase E activity RraB